MLFNGLKTMAQVIKPILRYLAIWRPFAVYNRWAIPRAACPERLALSEVEGSKDRRIEMRFKLINFFEHK